MKKTPVIRSITLAVATAAFALGAHADLPDESWWRLGRDAAAPATLGLMVDGARFCGIAAAGAAQERVWILRGRVVDGRLVESSREPLRGPVDALEEGDALDPTDFFVQPTAMVQRERSAQHPRGDFTLFEPLQATPGTSLWLDMAWHCNDGRDVDKVAAAGVER